ncbi:pimeloyl-ACP methyl ester carboxylesterase [Pseudacidovorax sp. 1753]|uniref:alpha/beta fold hydrolase n=1 Tax=Pseudacidovorax sp. 1753 TaxID=3156419 RepID=UPI0033989505
MTRHIVLIHGAWQGAWAFDAWLPLLRERGWQPHAVDLPGNGWPPLGDAPASLDTYAAHVAGVIDALGEPAVVLGHSGGGITASQVAEVLPQRVAALVYLAGMMLPSGMGFGELVRQVQAEQPGRDFSGIGPWLRWNADRSASRVAAEGALRCFVHDCEPAAAAQAAALLRPQPESGRAMLNRLSADRFGRVPRFYVECLDDQSVYHPLQARMQQLSPGARRLTLPCGHVPQLAAPQALTDLLIPELEALLP